MELTSSRLLLTTSLQALTYWKYVFKISFGVALHPRLYAIANC